VRPLALQRYVLSSAFAPFGPTANVLVRQAVRACGPRAPFPPLCGTRAPIALPHNERFGDPNGSGASFSIVWHPCPYSLATQ